RGLSLGIPYPFIIAEEKGVVLANRSPGRDPELVLSEGRLWLPSSVGKKILCIQAAVAQEFIRGAMEGVGAGASDGVHYPAGGLAVLCRIVARQHGKFLNGVYAEVLPENASRTAV